MRYPCMSYLYMNLQELYHSVPRQMEADLAQTLKNHTQTYIAYFSSFGHVGLQLNFHLHNIGNMRSEGGCS